MDAVRGKLRVPGDKSISHRALLMGAGAEGVLSLHGLGNGADIASSASALRALGWTLKVPHPGDLEGVVEIKGRRGWAPTTECVVDCGNSGTTLRLLAGALATGTRAVTLKGDASLSARPMGRVVEPLRLMGAEIEMTKDRPPLLLRGGTLQGIDYRMPVASAQVKSALLLAGIQADGETRIRESVPTRDHTERLLRFLGVAVASTEDGPVVKEARLFSDKVIRIPGDFSSAAFFLVAAAILPDSDVTVLGVGLNPTRTALLDLLRAFGAVVDVELEDGSDDHGGEPRGRVRVAGRERLPLHVSAVEATALIDELPLVAVLGAVAEGTTLVSGASELRVKESDRIAAMGHGLRALGARFEPLPDGFVVTGPTRLRGGRVDAAGDHRIAMALAVAALAASDPVTIGGCEAVGISYPGFFRDLGRLTVPRSS